MSVLLILIFGLIIILGMYLFTYVWANQETPPGVGIIHGIVGILAVFILLTAALFSTSLFPVLIMAILAVISGLILAARDILNLKRVTYFAIGHALIALCTFVTLILSGFFFFK